MRAHQGGNVGVQESGKYGTCKPRFGKQADSKSTRKEKGSVYTWNLVRSRSFMRSQWKRKTKQRPGFAEPKKGLLIESQETRFTTV